MSACADYQHYAATAFGESDRLADDAPNPPGAVRGLYAEEEESIADPGLFLCLFESGEVARGTVSELWLSVGAGLLVRNAVLSLRFFSQGAQLFAHCAVSAWKFSQGAGSVAWALSFRRQRC